MFGSGRVRFLRVSACWGVAVVLQLLKPPRRKNVGPADDLQLLTVTRWHGTDFWYTKF